jgi:geranylgeranyl diphosphate synthase type II
MVDAGLRGCLGRGRTRYTARLFNAMNYAVFPGGKRIRPLLTMASAYACGAEAHIAVPEACAVELIHSYSLVHDDLPAMDNDDFRRGKPTVHKRYGEGIAILAGDALLTLAFTVLAQGAARSGRRAANAIRALKVLSEGAGAEGMIAGQTADTFFDRRAEKSSAELLEFIHTKKTGALIAAAVMAGAAAAGASAAESALLKSFGEKIGLAFQIVDDIFDKDKDRLTYPAVFGVKESRRRAESLIARAARLLGVFGKRAAPLRELAEFVIERKA